jgi:hypothetical protein
LNTIPFRRVPYFAYPLRHVSIVSFHFFEENDMSKNIGKNGTPSKKKHLS